MFVSNLGGIEDERPTDGRGSEPQSPASGEDGQRSRYSTLHGRVDVDDRDHSYLAGSSDVRARLSEFAIRYFAEEWLSKLADGVSGRTGNGTPRKVCGTPASSNEESDLQPTGCSSDRSVPSRERETWERFHRAERSCFEINQRSKEQWRNSPFLREIVLARKIASKILGPFDWDQAARYFGWGPGATSRLTRRKSDAAHKYSGSPHATIGNAILANAVIRHTPLWARELPELPEEEGVGYVKIVPGNRVVTVPKNYKTDRTIAIEPDMNIYVQKGIGGVIRNRLRHIGVNLDDQTKNQRLAAVGSLSGRLATIDLSMASDCISRSIVEKLIRPDWLQALGQCRSPFGVLPSGEKIFYQKFSSMGNGYTFELETLIFLSLALAYARLHGEEVDRISVYGDDIIVPSTMAAGFCGLLSECGFTPNAKKSYWTGPFRESCGKHYYLGYDITPFYVKQYDRSLMSLFKIHNQLWRYQQRCDWLGDDRRRELLAVCRWLRSYAPAKWRRPSLIDGFGDGGFVGYFDEVCPSKAKRGWDGYSLTAVLEHPILDEDLDLHGLLVKSLMRTSRREIPADPIMSYEYGTSLLRDDDDVEVYPVTGRRYVVGEIFVSFSQLHRQCTGPFAPGEV